MEETMETEILDENLPEETEEKKSNCDENALFEAVIEKHETRSESEKLTDIFMAQLILCIVLVLIFTVINIFNSTLTEWFIGKFKTLSSGETEKIFIEAVNYAENILK